MEPSNLEENNEKIKIVLTAIFFGLFASSSAMSQEKHVTIYRSNPEQSIAFVSKTTEKNVSYKRQFDHCW